MLKDSSLGLRADAENDDESIHSHLSDVLPELRNRESQDSARAKSESENHEVDDNLGEDGKSMKLSAKFKLSPPEVLFYLFWVFRVVFCCGLFFFFLPPLASGHKLERPAETH